MGYGLRTPFLALIAACLLALASTLSAQKVAEKPVELAHYGPAQGAVYISIDRPAELDQSMTKVGLEVILGTSPAAVGSRPSTGILRAWIGEMLGAEDAAVLDALMHCEIAVLVPATGEVSKSVLLLRLPNQELFNRWVPSDQRRDTEIGDGARLCRANDGRMLGVRENIVAVARRTTNGRLFREVLRLMSGRSIASLDRDEDYLRLAPYLPAKDLVSIFVRPSNPENPAGLLNNLGLRSVLAAAYKDNDSINIAVRAALDGTARIEPLPESALDAMMNLPSTTLLSTAARWPMASRKINSVLDFASLMFQWVHPIFSQVKDAVGDSQSPNSVPVVLALTQCAGDNANGTPQVAVMIQTQRARALCEDIERALSDTSGGTETASELNANRPQRTEFEGRTLWSLPVCVDGSDHDRLECLLHLEPSWGALDEWFVFSSTKAGLQRILEAQQAKATRLSSVPEAAALRKRHAPRTALLLAQPFLATDLIDRWIEEAGRTEDSFVHVAWDIASDLTPAEGRDRMGISARGEQSLGVVTVALVEKGTPAYDRIRVGDRIVGTDGTLLRMQSPNADLRARWEKLRPHDPIVLRLQREETMMEVPLVKPEVSAAMTTEAIPGSVVAWLQIARKLVRSTPIVSVSFPATDENHLSVFISVRTSPPAGAAASR